MKKVRLSELWNEVDNAIQGDRASGVKFAIIEAHKILENTLLTLGYPGKTIEKKLYWAGYSLEDEGGIKSALDKREEILNNFDFPLSDLEAADIVALYKKVVHEIATREPFGFSKKLGAFYKVYLSPRSVYAWRNLAIFFGSLLIVKVLNYTSVGKGIVSFFVSVADLMLSWMTIAVIIVVAIIIVFVTNYRENKTKIKIKE